MRFAPNEGLITWVLSCRITDLAPQLIIKLYLIENKEVTLLV